MTKTRTPRKTSPGRRPKAPTASGKNPYEVQIAQLEQRLHRVLLENTLAVFDEETLSIYADKISSERGWTTVGVYNGVEPQHPVYTTEHRLGDVIKRSRRQEKTNPYARNIFENRVNYIVGSGSTYRVSANSRSGRETRFVRRVREFIEEWRKEVDWDTVEQNIVRRTDRDGECFLRLFRMTSGSTVVRFVDPLNVKTPHKLMSDPLVQFGIRLDPDDQVTPLAYYVVWGPGLDDYDEVDASDMIHFKGNVDSDAVRGLPITHSCFDKLDWSVKLLRNMAIVTTIQASIALIRKHGSATPETVKNFLDKRDLLRNSSVQGLSFSRLEAAGEPRILDSTQGVEYEFPAVQIDVSKMVSALQATLRASAASLQMPEFMISSDASNANYSSAMVSEGPAVRAFGRAQKFFGDGFVDIIGRAVIWAMRTGRLPAVPDQMDSVKSLLKIVNIETVPPKLKSEKSKEETDRRKILRDEGLLSPQRWSEEEGLDYRRMQREIRQHVDNIKELVGQAKGFSVDPVTGRVTPVQTPSRSPSGRPRQPAGGGRSAKPRPSRNGSRAF